MRSAWGFFAGVRLLVDLRLCDLVFWRNLRPDATHVFFQSRFHEGVELAMRFDSFHPNCVQSLEKAQFHRFEFVVFRVKGQFQIGERKHSLLLHPADDLADPLFAESVFTSEVLPTRSIRVELVEDFGVTLSVLSCQCLALPYIYIWYDAS